jgi:hypothetical protein
MAKRYQTATKTTTWSRRYSRNQKSIKLLLTMLKEVEKMQSMTTVTVAIASTRGRQRSPAFAYRLGELLMRKRHKVKVFHKDADREVDQYSVALFVAHKFNDLRRLRGAIVSVVSQWGRRGAHHYEEWKDGRPAR